MERDGKATSDEGNCNLTPFDSLDHVLRPDLFTPQSEENWQHCVKEHFKLNLITDLEYARIILMRYDDAVLVGVDIELEEGYVVKNHLLGFDILDSYCAISLVTNWIPEEDCIDGYVMLSFPP